MSLENGIVVEEDLLSQDLSPLGLAAPSRQIDDVLETQGEISKDIRVFIARTALPECIAEGVLELARQPARSGSIKVVEEMRGQRKLGDGWIVGFVHDTSLQEGHMKIQVFDPETGVQAEAGSSAANAESKLQIQITFRRPCEAFRGLGHVLATTRYALALATSSAVRNPDAGNADDDMSISSGSSATQSTKQKVREKVNALLEREELCNFETMSAMIDCSRNGVLKVDGVKFFLRQMAQVGLNMLYLYCEDTYEIPGEPFFGYFRGPYTTEELKEIDDYAYMLGIEVVPCIQTLGHLAQMLQWPRYNHMQDTADVLLAESEAVYQFIEKMITAITGPLRTKRIHIGMDEAFGLGEGRYRHYNRGVRKDGTKIFTDHLRRVDGICRKLGVKPLIWSDMLFCLAANNVSLTGYYEGVNPATPETVRAIPEDIELVFWSYYHTQPDPYIQKIKQHWDLVNKPPWMASGLWTWARFWCSLPFTFETVRASMKATKAPESGVKHVMTTIWGDEGNECDVYSCLPGLYYYAEHGYTRDPEVDVTLLKLKFDGIVGGSFDSFVNASKMDDLHPEFQPTQTKATVAGNMSKWLLWEEPFYGFMAPQYSSNYDLERHYGGLADYLALAVAPEHDADNTIGLPVYPFNKRLHLPQLLSQVLSLKCHLRDWLSHAYKARDLEQLELLAGPGPNSRLGQLRTAVDHLWRYHRSMWMQMYKPFGWENLELRYGGLRARLDTMQDRISCFLDKDNLEVTDLPELEVETQPIWPGAGLSLLLEWQRAAKPTVY